MGKSTRLASPAAVHCPHRPPCPGCPRFGEPGIAAAAFRALAELARQADLPPPQLVAGAPLGYRVRARLAVRGRASSPKVGIFQEGSHRIVDIPRCLVHHPVVNEVAAALRAAIRATGTPPYADRTHRGLLRYLQVVVERASGRAQVVLVTNDVTAATALPLAERLAALLGPGLHSLWWNGNPARTNTILGPHWQRLAGEETVRERIGGAVVHFPPGAFGQANLDLADALVERVQGWVPDGATVVELHAGCGAIGLGLAARVRALAMNEAAPAALAGLARGIEELDAAVRARTRVLPGPAEGHLEALAGADVVIADPPRKGLGTPLLEALCRRSPERLVLVSCSLPAFLDEARRLHAAGLRLRALVPYALVPQTEHVETAALFAARLRTPW